MMGKKTGQTVK